MSLRGLLVTFATMAGAFAVFMAEDAIESIVAFML